MVVTDVNGSLSIAIARNASTNLRLVTKTATPASVTAMLMQQMELTSTIGFGLYFYDGTKLMGIECVGTTAPISAVALKVVKYTNVTTVSTTPFNLPLFGVPGVWPGPIYLQITNGGGTLAFLWSIDGITFHSVFSEAAGTFLTPTAYGVGGGNASSTTSDTLEIALQSVVTT
jgi:hypothetical protein